MTQAIRVVRPIPQVFENPSYPVVFLTVLRAGRETSFTIDPTSMDFISSVSAADMLEITVADPDYLLIDHEDLVEDFQTHVELTFGWENGPRMSGKSELLFVRQRPRFSEGGGVETTLVCYDKSFLFSLPLQARLFTSDSPINVKDLVRECVKWANTEFAAGLDPEPDFGGHEFEGLSYRVQKPPGTINEFLTWLREIAKSTTTDMPPEVYVRNSTLVFRPVQKQSEPIARFEYHSAIPGERLLSFDPQVNMRPNFQEVGGVDQETGEKIEERAGDETKPNRQTLVPQMRNVNANSGVSQKGATRLGDSTGKATPASNGVTHPWQQGDTLESVSAKYPGSTVEGIVRANGIDNPTNPAIAPGRPVSVPVTKPDEGVTTYETTAQAVAAYILAEDQTAKADASVMGDPDLAAGFTVWVRNVGRKWSKLWYILEARHRIGSSGYVVELLLSREGIPLGRGLGDSTASEVPLASGDGEKTSSAAKQKTRQEQQKMRDHNANTGAIRPRL
jgi:LysM repeat protein